MKRYVLLAIVILAAGFFGGNMYFTHTMEQRLETLARMVQPFGRLDYRKVSLTPFGDAYINGVSFRPANSDEEVWIDRLALRAGNLWALHGLPDDLRRGRLPERLGVSVTGLRIGTNGSLFSGLQAAAENNMMAFDAAGCGERRGFDGYDLAEMNYWELVMDTDVAYVSRDNGRALELSASSLLHGMASTNLTMRMQMPDSPGNAKGQVQLGRGMQLDAGEFRYRDLGYADQVLNFCAAETGLDLPAYKERHLKAWANLWKAQGFDAGPNVIRAYTRFLSNPGTFTLGISSAGGGMLPQFGQSVMDAFEMTMHVNGEAMGPLDMKIMTPQALAAFRASQPPAAAGKGQTPDEQTERTAAPGLQVVRMDDLAGRVNSYGEIRLLDGRLYRGRITAVHDDNLEFQRQLSGGHITTPIPFSSIAEIRLR